MLGAVGMVHAGSRTWTPCGGEHILESRGNGAADATLRATHRGCTLASLNHNLDSRVVRSRNRVCAQ